MGKSRRTTYLIFSLLALMGLVLLLNVMSGDSSESALAQAPPASSIVSPSEDATATPSPTQTASVTATPTASATATPTASPAATATVGVPPLATPARFASYNGIQEASTSITIPLVFRNLTFAGTSDWNSAIRVQNTTAISASVLVLLRDTDGDSMGYWYSVLPPFAVGLYDLRATTLSDGFIGSAKISAVQPVAAVVIQQSDSSMGDFFDTSPGFMEGSTEILFNLVFKNYSYPPYNSLISIANLGYVSTTLTLTFSSGFSTYVFTETASVNPGGAAVFDLSSLTSLSAPFYGQLRVTSDNAPVAGSLVTARLLSANTVYNVAMTENAFFSDREPEPPGPYKYYVPRLRRFANVPEYGADANSGIAIGNESIATTTVTIDFYGEDGNLLGDQMMTLDAGSQVSFLLPNLSFLPYAYEGAAVVTSDRPVAVSVRTSIWNTYSAITTYSGGPAAMTSFIPIVYNQPPWVTSSTFVQNTSNSQSVHVRIDYYRTDGSLALTSEDDLPPSGSRKYHPDFANISTAFTRGSAIVSSSGPPIVAIEEIYGYNAPPPTPTPMPPRAYLPLVAKNYTPGW